MSTRAAAVTAGIALIKVGCVVTIAVAVAAVAACGWLALDAARGWS